MRRISGGAFVVALEEVGDTDDHVAPVVELALQLVGGVGDLALEVPLLHAAQRAFEHRAVAQRVEVLEHELRRAPRARR
jgi:hypothetical protein